MQRVILGLYVPGRFQNQGLVINNYRQAFTSHAVVAPLRD